MRGLRQMKVRLQTTAHQRGEVYTIILNNIIDLAPIPNSIEPNTAYSYSLPQVDLEKPTIIAVKLLDESNVSITFSEKIEKESAEHIDNYQINKGITINKAQLSTDEITVILKTSAHVRGETYLIHVSGVKDQSPVPNEILPNSPSSYYFDQVENN